MEIKHGSREQATKAIEALPGASLREVFDFEEDRES